MNNKVFNKKIFPGNKRYPFILHYKTIDLSNPPVDRPVKQIKADKRAAF